MGAPDIKADAQRVFAVFQAGGIAIYPASMGYTLGTANSAQLTRAFQTKKRGSHKRHAMGGSFALHRELHVMDPRNAEIVRCLTQDFDIPMGVVAKYKTDHPMLKAIDDTTMEAASNDGSLAMLINAGSLQDEICKLTMAADMPFLGSSANITGTGMSALPSYSRSSWQVKLNVAKGTKYVVEDIPSEILEIADLVIDYGLVKWGSHGRSSTMIDFSGPSLDVIRIGVGYDVIKDHLKRFWDIDTPDDPGKASLPSGHLKVLQPLASLDKLVAAY